MMRIVNITKIRIYISVIQKAALAAIALGVVLTKSYAADVAPTASFSTSGTLCQYVAVDFIDNSSTGVGSIILWAWNFDDGTSSNVQYPSHEFTESGDYDVTLTVIDSNGESDIFISTITVEPAPDMDFSITSTDFCLLTNQTFASLTTISSGSIDAYKWDYGDGSISFNQNGSHTYLNAGTYTITLTATSDQNCENTTTNEITIYEEPVASFDFTNPCLGDAVDFINTSSVSSGNLSYLWDFGDGNSSVLSSPSHEYASAGDYDVLLQVTSSDGGCQTTIEQPVAVYENPVSAFTADPVCFGDEVSFVNNSTGGNLTFLWNFGDGNSSTNLAPTHTYDSQGSYMVSLVVTSDDNCTHSTELRVDVTDNPLPVFFSSDVCQDATVLFTNLSNESGAALTYQWDFGDGQQSIEKNPEHFYELSGNYEVTLTAMTASNCIESVSDEVDIFPLPVPDFNVEAVCDGEESLFFDASSISSGLIESYLWDFGDLTNSTSQNPSKQYLNPGSYNVTLTITSEDGCQQAITKGVVVEEVPVANFEISNVCFGDAVLITNTSIDNSLPLTFDWDFGDGTTSVATNPVHTYSEAGVHTISLTATSGAGCLDIIEKTVIVYATPEVDAGEDITISLGESIVLNAQGGDNYQWHPIEGLSNSSIPNPIARPLEDTDYVVLVTDQFGCQNEDTVRVTVQEDFKIVANNIFTPDGNGQNDQWIIQNADAFERVEVRVYDRYGKLVFEDNDYQNDWEGTFDKDILPDGTYYYLITFPGANNKYNGAITILRNK
ncbi:MAG: PKD domain-containing protein [Cytophagales bacterium]|nr:PKD domain-containing protein [Cytophagales bacterium]